MKENKGQKAIIDWLEFTLLDIKSPHTIIIEILKLELQLFEKVDRGKLGYKEQLLYNNISILYDGNDNMGIHVILSGKGCRAYEMNHTLIGLIQRINNHNGKLTRIDLAIDDFEGDYIPYTKLKNDIIKGNITAKWKTSLETIKRNLNGETIGHTIQLGSRTSNTMLRLYDKAMEQGLENKIWTRLELEIKKENAQEVQKIITTKNAGEIIKGILNNYMRIIQPNPNDSNKSRWKSKKYWEKIINGMDKIKLTQQGETKTIEQKKEWLEKQVGQTLALVTLADGSIDYLYDLVKDNIDNFKTKNIILLEQIEKLKEGGL